MKRKFLAAMLSLSMVLGTGVTAFAADTVVENADNEGVYGAEISGTSGIEVPTIKVTVPATLGEVGLNPYGMTYTVDSTDYTDKIVSIANEIINESNVAIGVNVSSMAAEVPTDSGVIFSAADLKGTETTKSVFMYLEMVKDGDKFADAYSKTATNQLLVSIKAASKDSMVVLAAGDTTATKAQFKFAGKVAEKPAKAWNKKDVFTVKVKFTFTPQVVEAAKS